MKYKVIVLAFLALFLSGCNKQIKVVNSNSDFISKPEIININEPSPNNSMEASSTVVTSAPNKTIPEKYYISNIPFSPQAPFANWEEPYAEACEETSVLMAWHFLQNEKDISREQFDLEILKMVSWQINNWGKHSDLTTTETAKLVTDYLNTKAIVRKNISLDDIILELSKNHPVIVPAAGKLLKNPNFKNPGPVYHMLVIRGYNNNKKEFTTNDPGTRKGENYIYTYNVLYDAIHDWNGSGDNITGGEKNMLILSI